MTLAQSWNTKEAGLDLPQLAKTETEIPESLDSVVYQFYRTLDGVTHAAAASPFDGPSQGDKPAAAASIPQTPTPAARAAPSASGVAPAPLPVFTSAPDKPAPSSSHKRKASGDAKDILAESQNPSKPPPSSILSEGMVVVTGSVVGKSDKELLAELLEEYKVPKEHKFGMLNRIRVTMALQDPAKRLQMLRIRLYAIGALGELELDFAIFFAHFFNAPDMYFSRCSVPVQLFPEDVSQSKIFLYEPDLAQRLVDIVMAGDATPRSVQIAAVIALEAIAKLRGHLSEVMTALSATTNHGPMMLLLRKTLASLDDNCEFCFGSLSPMYLVFFWF